MKYFTALLIFLHIFVSTGCQSKTQGHYYVSNNGSDNANGRTPQTAWKSIDKVNSARFLPGDTVYFEAGSTWRGTLQVDPGAIGKPVVYTRYGTGKNPRFIGSEMAGNWQSVKPGSVWKASGTFEDMRKYYGAEIWFLEKDSVIWGDFQEYTPDLSNLKKEYDWTWSNGAVYVCSPENPGTRYDGVEVPQRERCVTASSEASSYIVIDGIDMAFSKRSGYYSGYPEVYKQTDLTIRNCHIAYIGLKGASSAYGIVAFHSNFLVENCVINDCGRRAISVNMYTKRPAGEEINIRNLVIRNNVFKRGYHTTSLDLAMMEECKGDTIREVYFYNNYIDDHEIFMEGEDKLSNQIFTQEGAGYISNVYIYNNIFNRSTGRNILIEGGDSVFIWNNTIFGHNENITKSPYSNVSLNHVRNVDYRNNILYDNLGNNNLNSHGVMMYYVPGRFIQKDYNLYYSLFPGTERHFSTHRVNNAQDGSVGYWNTLQWGTYKSRNPLFEQHSPVPADPGFVDNRNDFHLRPGSPAIGAGVPIKMITTDFYGDPVNNPPDLGAIRFNPGSTK